MYTKCYNPAFLGEKNRQIIFTLKTWKKQVEDRLRKSEKKVKNLEANLKEVREKEEGSQNTLEEECQSWEDSIKATIEAQNICFKLEKKHTDDAEATKTKAEMARKQLEQEVVDLKKRSEEAEKKVETTEEQAKKLENNNLSAFEDGTYGFLFSTWLEHLKTNFSFLRVNYANQVTEWSVDLFIREGGLQARVEQRAQEATGTSDPLTSATPSRDSSTFAN